MEITEKSVFGVFQKASEAKAAQAKLNEEGLRTNITVQPPDIEALQNDNQQKQVLLKPFTVFGAIIGAILFTVVGIMINLNVLTFSTSPESAPVSNQLAIQIFCLIGGVILGAAAGALVGNGTPPPAKKRYSNYLEAGQILMSVPVSDPAGNQIARETLDRTGASDVKALNRNDKLTDHLV